MPSAGSDVEVAAADPGDPESVRALAAYVAEVAARLPGGFAADGVQEAAEATYRPPTGLWVLACVGDATVGCAALQHLDAGTSEVKRMWVDPAARGRGVASALLAHLEAAAVAAGRRRLVLDTSPVLTAAVALYRRHGFVEVAPYNGNPDAGLWFAKDLAP